MRLSDIMSSMALSSYAEVALIIFLFVFFAIAVRLFFFSDKDELQSAARLPIDDSESATPVSPRALSQSESS